MSLSRERFYLEKLEDVLKLGTLFEQFENV